MAQTTLNTILFVYCVRTQTISATTIWQEIKVVAQAGEGVDVVVEGVAQGAQPTT